MLQEIFPLYTHQLEVSLLHREVFENGILDQCLKLGITLTAWSPFKGGALLERSSMDREIAEAQKVIKSLCEKEVQNPHMKQIQTSRHTITVDFHKFLRALKKQLKTVS